jgi:hypothetical protein
MLKDEFRLYNSFKPIKVEQKNYILFYDDSEINVKKKLNKYSSFSIYPWSMNKDDFRNFVKTNRVHYIETFN